VLREQFPDRVPAFKRSAHYPTAMDAIARAFMGITNALDAEVLNEILAVVPFLVEADSTAEYVDALCFIAAHMYHQFKVEAAPRGSDDPSAILVDSAYLAHDLWASLKCHFQALSPFFETQRTPSVADDIFWQLEWTMHKWMPGADCAPLRQQIGRAIKIYQTAFATFLPKREELLIVWTILFVHGGDLSIFHRFCVCIWSTTGTIPLEGELPMVLYRHQVGRWVLGIDAEGEREELRNAALALDALIELLKTDDREKRALVRFQIAQIVKVARGRAHMDEVLPIDALLHVAW
jgi:hypothetical protein